jgi:RHS repeat-associated protein
VFGTLTQEGACPYVRYNPGDPSNPLPCFFTFGNPPSYAPEFYTYTDPYGTAYRMAASGELKSITDRQGNTLSFEANGIVSSTGKTVTYERDTQGRITKVDYTALFGPYTDAAQYTYDDTTGDLKTAALPPINNAGIQTTQYTYAQHRLLTTIDPRGNTARTSTYDTNGRLATDTDAAGNVTKYTYDLATRTNTTTYPDTGVVKQTLDARGLVLSETDQLGHTTTHEYDANRNETKRTNALGEVTTATYDERGNQTSLTNLKGTSHATFGDDDLPRTFTDRLGHVTSIDYDDRHLPKRIKDEIGTRMSFSNSEQGLPLTIEDAEGHRAFLTYDAAGNVSSRTDWLGRVTLTTYDAAGRPLTETSARGAVSTNNYVFGFGRLGSAIEPNGHSMEHGYDANGNLIADNDLPRIRGDHHYAYDALNHLTQVIHFPVGSNPTTVTYTRDFRGNALSMTDENGHTTSYEYDVMGHLTKTTYADGTSTTRMYDALNRLASLTDERGNTTTYEYDAGCGCSDRVTKVTDALGHSTTTTFDADGRKSSVTDANGRTTSYAYDVRGALVETDFPDGTSTVRNYDSRGRIVSMTDQTDATTLYGYDEQGQATSITDPLGHVTRYTYDADGNIASHTDANNHTTFYEYDSMNRKTKRTLPLGQSETFAYDLAGRPSAHTDFRGKTTVMTFDSLDRMLTKVPDDSLGEAPHSYSYSPTGMRISATDGTGTTSYTYDVRDRLLTKATPAGTLTYTYDSSGNVASVRSSNANGTSVNYVWDAANQLSSVTDNRAGGTTTATYTSTKRPSSLTQPNGVTVSYSYDSMDRVAGMTWQQAAASAFGSWQYSYNERGQRRSATDITGRRADYGYDAASRLVSETISGAGASGNGAINYVLDAFANRVSRASGVSAVPSASYTYDGNDQLTTDSHDANGNTTSSAGHTYAYDFEDRLVSKDGTAVTYQYNGDGDRVAKTVGGVTTQFLVDGLNPTGYLQVLEEVVGGAVQTRYTYGTSIISQTRNVSTTPVTSYYGSDAHGNITFLTDADGSVTDSYDYDAWGILVARTGTTPNSRLYAGEELDPDLGLFNLRARQYSPGTGRFFTSDPLDSVASAAPREGKLAAAVANITNPYFRAALDITIPDRAPFDGRVFSPVEWNRGLYTSAEPVNRIDPTGRNEAGEEVLLIAFILQGQNLALHAAELLLRDKVKEESEKAKLYSSGAMYCAGLTDAADPILFVMGFNPYFSLGLAVINTLCTFIGIFGANAGG